MNSDATNLILIMKRINPFFASLCIFFFTSISYGQIVPVIGGETCETAVPLISEGDFATPNDGTGSSHWFEFTGPCDGFLTFLISDQIRLTEGYMPEIVMGYFFWLNISGIRMMH